MKDPAVADPLRSAQRLVYIAEPKGRDYQQLPDETEAMGGGDCEDLATWLAQRYWENGLNARIETGKFRTGDKDLHCWVELEYNGDIYVIDSGARVARKRTDLHAGRFVPFVLLRDDMPKGDFERTEYRLMRLEAEFDERYFQFYGHYPGLLPVAASEPVYN
jgi:transglutaminase-like putative cysteine protease